MASMDIMASTPRKPSTPSTTLRTNSSKHNTATPAAATLRATNRQALTDSTVFDLPFHRSTPPLNLQPFTNESSSYVSVCRALQPILQLGHGGTNATTSNSSGSDESPEEEASSIDPTKDGNNGNNGNHKDNTNNNSNHNNDITTPSTTTNATLLHTGTYALLLSHSVWPALVQCLHHHSDRRCRLLAARALATTGRTAYARTRPSPLWYNSRSVSMASGHTNSSSIHATQPPDLVTRLADDVCDDVSMALATAAGEEEDDGVAAAALAALGWLIWSSRGAADDALVGDELTAHVGSMLLQNGTGVAAYAPTLRSVQDEDPVVALQECQVRIVEQVLSPRVWSLLDRALRWGPSSCHTTTVLPVLTHTIRHLIHLHGTGYHGTDRTTFSKRWTELDVVGLADTLWQHLLEPALGHRNRTTHHGPTNGACARTAAQCTLTLCAALPTRHWVGPAYVASASVLRDELTRSMGSAVAGARSRPGLATPTRLSWTATLLVALRGVSLADRVPVLAWLVGDVLVKLPSTVPHVPCGPGLSLTRSSTDGSVAGPASSYANVRAPVRIALWTEVALHFLVDGPCATSRADALRTFLASPAVAALLVEGESVSASGAPSKAAPPALATRDELLLAFAAATVQVGRSLRVTADGTLRSVDAQSQIVQDWIQVAGVVLQAFVGCGCANASVATPFPFLEENVSLRMAGLSSYVQLLQEYLHLNSLLLPNSSVALKLGANACPPHILFDHLSESATFLSRSNGLPTEDSILNSSSALLDEIVRRELLEKGILSHHMRLFVLALAADQWVQGRIACIRRQQNGSVSSSSNGNSFDPASSLRMASGRDILRAVAPKRLLAKMAQARPPVATDSQGKSKRDPLKKLALETVKVSVACIENVALLACDWRRRFGSNQESKHLVSVAVGLLQGKVDETPLDDLMNSVMGPTCEAAVARIQAFYENASQSDQQTFPLSELVAQPVKLKIKPLVSSSKANTRPKGDTRREYLTQLCRQIVAARTQLAIQAYSPAIDTGRTRARPNVHCLRLAVPPLPERQDGRLFGCRSDAAMACWGHTIRQVSAPSDPAQVLLAYTPRRHMRYDGSDMYTVTVMMRVFNMTAIDFFDGIRLEVSVAQTMTEDDETENDSLTMAHLKALGCNLEDLENDFSLFSKSATDKRELKSGEFVTWEVPLGSLTCSNSLQLIPTLTYRNVVVESYDAGAILAGEDPSQKDTSSVNSAAHKSGEDDFQVKDTDGQSSFKTKKEDTHDVRMTGESLVLHPLVFFQPCPLVFFCDRCGDVDSFRFLWFRAPYQLAPIRVAPSRPSPSSQPNPISLKIAKMSSLTWEGEAIPGGVATRLWAFMTMAGRRVVGVLSESDNPDTMGEQILYFRGDDKKVLFSIAGSKQSRSYVVNSMLPGMLPVE